MKSLNLCLLILAAGLVLGSSSEALAAKEKFVRNKPHVNVSGPYALVAGESVVVQAGLFAPGELAGGAPPSNCRGVFDLRVEEKGGSSVLASNIGAEIRQDDSAVVVGSSPGGIDIRVVVVARDMEVDGKACIFRGQVEFVASTGVTRSFPIRRADFALVRK